MSDSSQHPQLGELIWESPVVPSVPGPVLYLIGGAFVLLGLSFSIVAVPMLSNARDRSGGIAASVVIVILVGSGIWLTRRARSARRLLGVQFFQHGVDFGPTDRRRSVEYTQLEWIHFEPYDEQGWSARWWLALAILGGSPAALGVAIGKSTAEKIESVAVIKLPNEPELSVPMFEGIGQQVESAVKARMRRL